tara:strand:- start:1564 stop:1728 length:165 start_codon:yes stop_codon:yes gene_type:complete
MIRTLRPAAPGATNPEGNTNNVGALDGKRVASVESGFKPFRQLRKAWTFHTGQF